MKGKFIAKNIEEENIMYEQRNLGDLKIIIL